MKFDKHIPTIILCLLFSVNTVAYNLRQINSRDGLSNSSVYCLYQDDDRFLWIGTFDGLNMYDGRNIHIYKPDINNRYSLSSNVIRNIIETKDDYLWISTKWGLNKLSQKENIIIEYHNQFKDDSHICKDSRNNLYVLGKIGVLSFYDEKSNSFIDLPINNEIVCKDVTQLFIDDNDMLWINHNGFLERYTISFGRDGKPQVIRQADYPHQYPIVASFSDKGKLLFINSIGDLYRIDPQRTIFIRNIQPLIKENGNISSIIYDDNDLLIGFKTNGVFRLQANNNYKEERIDINCGVFSLWKDDAQNVVWIGTDGQGVYSYTKDNYTFNNISLSQLPIKKQRPIRAIFTDHLNNLWMGTKDNGVIRIQNYAEKNEYLPDDITHYTTNEGLCNNEVFAFTYSPIYNVLWIGSDGQGINYYSYQDRKIHTLINNTSNKITYVHSLFESKDSILWIGSGNSLLKMNIDRQGNSLIVNSSKRISFDLKNNQPYNNIYALYQESDSIIWVGIRGNGIIRFNSQNEQYKLISFDKDGIAPMNDILCIHQDNNLVLWLGTSYGLIRFVMNPNGTYEYKNYNENNGLPNNTIHGILPTSDGRLWLSSNTGIILFDPFTESFRNFNQKSGLKNIEFSDNAYFRDDRTSMCFFGGVDGIVSIRKEQTETKKFIPDIYFTKIRLFNDSYMIGDYEEEDGEGKFIQLKNNQNFFAVSFVSVDFINGENSRYFYRLKNFSDEWMEAKSNEAQFTNIAHGTYVLEVKYNDGTGMDDQISSLRIVILPPWYLSIYAKIIYTLLIIGAICGIFLYIEYRNIKKRRKISRKLEEKYKDEMYEGKLRFFTNITHELSTPLTLIYGPCKRILAYENTDSFVKKYMQIIKSNTERLNSLIQEIIDFRRIETGNNTYHIEKIDVSKLTQDVAESFEELAEQNNIHFETDIVPDIYWNTDLSSYTKIVSNLISNAFKYTPQQGRICVSMDKKDDNLVLTVYNTGKGIQKENIPLIFNRYSVLDNVKENSIKGLSARNGLGLAICHNLTESLQGNIQVKSEVDQYAEFIVTLPSLEISEALSQEKGEETNTLLNTDSQKQTNILIENINKEHILIIDDNKDLLWMLKDIFEEDYTLYLAEDGMKGLEILRKETPDLIITDIMMPEIDGITLAKQIKENKHTMHIPLVILSAKGSDEEKIEGFDSGADVYIPKPFDVEYLKAVVRHLIKAKKDLQNYYNSSASAYEYSKGQLLEKEDKAFLESSITIINNNINNSDFNVDELANYMQTSVRNLYRRFKELDQPTPNDLIKELRLKLAAKLLVTTSFTIQEVMYKSGFNNRSHFYREFSKTYGKTPKEYRDEYKVKDQLL